MAGIAGIIGKEGTPKKVEKMLERIHYRGTDNTLVFKTPIGTAGFVGNYSPSQKKIGFSAGKGPLVLVDGFFDCDDTQYEKGTSDAECLKHLYMVHGKKAFSMIHGSFACAVYDDQECIILRDHVGARPVIYDAEGENLIFASEGKALSGLTRRVKELPPGY
ncbi:MAG: hypothetical protein PF495_16280, partial [Spirochaetales bacterium]|nr:hypothetical protein [Spirochaetales bacterium]